MYDTFSVHSPPQSLSFGAYALAVLLGLLANVVCDEFLADLGLGWGGLRRRQVWLRLARWAGLLVGPVLAVWCGGVERGYVWMIGVAMFGAAAGCDLESSYVPPDWYTVGGAVVMLVVWWLWGGASALADAVLAQGVCYGAMVFGVAVLRVASGGDIKLMMQYGAVLGGLPAIGWALLVEWVVRVVWLGGWVLREVSRGRIDEVAGGVRMLRAPHGPFAWLGVVIWMLVF